MNATERAARLQGLEIYDEMTATMDERTLEILDRRRRTTVVKRRGWLMRRMLLAADVAGLIAAMALAEWLVNRHNNMGVLGARDEVLVFLATLPGWVVVAKLYGLYDHDEERTDHSTADDFSGVFHMVTVCTWVFVVGAHLTALAHPSPSKLAIFWAAAIAFVTMSRAAARIAARRNAIYLQNTVIVGAGDVGQLVAKKLLQHPEYGINLVGFIDDQPKDRRDDLEHLALLGGRDRVAAIIRLFDIERVIVAFSNESHEDTLELIRSVKDLDVQIDVVPRLFEIVGPNVGIHTIEGLPLFGLPPSELSRSSKFLKRSLDIAIAALALVVLSPLLLLIAIAVKVDSRGPIFYRHRRVGYKGAPIDVVKFRTMKREACRGERYGGAAAEAEFESLVADPERGSEFAETYKLRDDPRVTRLGGVLRRASLDELPQLLNVLAGQLSLVGPRPVTQDELGRYGEWAPQLLDIKPGVTGYWQINGRSQLSYTDRVRLDLAYATGWSLGLDLLILGKTVRVLATRRGAS